MNDNMFEGRAAETEHDHSDEDDEGFKEQLVKDIKSCKKLTSTSVNSVEFDWEFFDLVDNILVYTNVVLNDIEIFQTPEIYSTFIRNYHSYVENKVIDKLSNSIYRIVVDKNHRISNRRYNAMYSKELIKTFNNMFWLYCHSVTSKEGLLQQTYFEMVIKLIYHNILLVNDKTLCSSNLATEFDATQDMFSFSQMNKGNTAPKDRTANRNIKAILAQNPSIFEDLQICFVKLSQSKKLLDEEVYQQRMIQVIFLFVYLLIGCKDHTGIDPIETVITTKDYLFKYPHTTKYGMLFFMLIFSDKYNKCSFDFKKKFIMSKDGVDSLVMKLNESQDETQLMRNIYLVCLICLETSKELKSRVISKVDLLKLFDNIKVYNLKVNNQKMLISYIIEMCCLSNEMLYFPIQDQHILKEMFNAHEVKFVRNTIENVFMNLSEFLPKAEEDDIIYTENDFLSASQANVSPFDEEDEQENVREAFAFIESDFLNFMFIILFQLDKRLKNEFLSSLIPLIEQKNE